MRFFIPIFSSPRCSLSPIFFSPPPICFSLSNFLHSSLIHASVRYIFTLHILNLFLLSLFFFVILFFFFFFSFFSSTWLSSQREIFYFFMSFFFSSPFSSFFTPSLSKMTHWRQRHGGKIASTPFVSVVYYHGEQYGQNETKVASIEIRFEDVRQTIGVRFLASISLSPTSPTSSSVINDHGDFL